MASLETNDTGGSGRRSHVRSWIGVLTGPAAWVTQLIGNWVMGEVVACAPASGARGSILGLHVNSLSAVATAVLLALTVAAGVLSFNEWRAVRAEGGEDAETARWLALAGVMTSALFTIVISASFVPIALVGGCR
jgi:hypothetical protein